MKLTPIEKVQLYTKEPQNLKTYDVTAPEFHVRTDAVCISEREIKDGFKFEVWRIGTLSYYMAELELLMRQMAVEWCAPSTRDIGNKALLLTLPTLMSEHETGPRHIIGFLVYDDHAYFICPDVSFCVVEQAVDAILERVACFLENDNVLLNLERLDSFVDAQSKVLDGTSYDV